jgi:hypothetical protein
MPPCIFIHPSFFGPIRAIERIGAQFDINLVPVGTPYIFWPKLWVSHNIQKLIKALLSFLAAVAPVPVAQEKRVLVGIWRE